ncbi:DNA-3-methyladenine glycosylase [Clostridium paridis]|uniref:Putative 3-methyladenine DNA glycosylase n=1 Tax=Clostridium paridis TaxID=2803863 RepID=A0A937FG46_9CLOT|nr:DNA-3-methyladenine glycosylase [Clostridium paridis]MBL4931383.1 DNA-3-methyladenine glycosylase [Clostridium paridis]
MRLERGFFARETVQVAKELLGKVLVREVDDQILKGKIVETEAYVGPIDKASHAYGFKKTARVEPLYGKPGISYVFSIYGMYVCFNIITFKEGSPEGVLIRALEPIEGIDSMSINRFKKEYEELDKKKIKELTNGPSKLCIAMNITKKEHNFIDLITSSELYVEDGEAVDNMDIVETTRIGIDYAEEARYFPWRFYIKENEFVSKK